MSQLPDPTPPTDDPTPAPADKRSGEGSESALSRLKHLEQRNPERPENQAR